MFKSFFENVKKPKNNFGGRLMLIGMNRGHEKLASWGRSFLEIDKDHTVVDLGCGGGRNIQFFLTKAKRVYGLDYSPSSVLMAEKLNKKEVDSGRCKIIEGDVSALPFKDESVDIVSAFETIYFWKDLNKSFGEIYRILRKNGQFLICNESGDKNEPKIKKWAEMLDFSVYNGDELEAILKPLGFDVEYEVNMKGYIALLAKKL